VLFLAVAAITGGVVFLQKNRAWRAGPHYAVDTLNEALRKKDAELFAQAVDTRAVAASFAGVAADLPGTDGRASILADAGLSPDQVQNFLRALALAEPLPRFEAHGVPALPDDFAEQLLQSPFALIAVVDDRALAESVIRHPALGDHTSLRLELARRENRWAVVAIANLKSLLTEYERLASEAAQRQREAERLDLENQIRRMAELLPDLACSGSVTTISGGMPLLVLGLKSGPYQGQETMTSWGVVFSLLDGGGEEIATPRVRQSIPVPAGARINDTWYQELEEAEYRRLYDAGPLSCLPEREYMIFHTGEILRSRQQDAPRSPE
jgi:hypothetical protein